MSSYNILTMKSFSVTELVFATSDLLCHLFLKALTHAPETATSDLLCHLFLKALTHAPETGARNRRHKFDTGFWRQFFMLIASGTKKLALIYDVKINNGRWPRRSSFHPVEIITQFNTKQRSNLRRKFVNNSIFVTPLHSTISRQKLANQTKK